MAGMNKNNQSAQNILQQLYQFLMGQKALQQAADVTKGSTNMAARPQQTPQQPSDDGTALKKQVAEYMRQQQLRQLLNAMVGPQPPGK